EAKKWRHATELLPAQQEKLLECDDQFVKNAIDRMPTEHWFADPQLIHIKVTALAHLGDLRGAVGVYREVLAQRISGAVSAEAITSYQSMAGSLVRKGRSEQAVHLLRNALKLQ